MSSEAAHGAGVHPVQPTHSRADVRPSMARARRDVQRPLLHLGAAGLLPVRGPGSQGLRRWAGRTVRAVAVPYRVRPAAARVGQLRRPDLHAALDHADHQPQAGRPGQVQAARALRHPRLPRRCGRGLGGVRRLRVRGGAGGGGTRAHHRSTRRPAALDGADRVRLPHCAQPAVRVHQQPAAAAADRQPDRSRELADPPALPVQRRLRGAQRVLAQLVLLVLRRLRSSSPCTSSPS